MELGSGEELKFQKNGKSTTPMNTSNSENSTPPMKLTENQFKNIGAIWMKELLKADQSLRLNGSNDYVNMNNHFITISIISLSCQH